MRAHFAWKKGLRPISDNPTIIPQCVFRNNTWKGVKEIERDRERETERERPRERDRERERETRRRERKKIYIYIYKNSVLTTKRAWGVTFSSAGASGHQRIHFHQLEDFSIFKIVEFRFPFRSLFFFSFFLSFFYTASLSLSLSLVQYIGADSFCRFCTGFNLTSIILASYCSLPSQLRLIYNPFPVPSGSLFTFWSITD